MRTVFDQLNKEGVISDMRMSIKLIARTIIAVIVAVILLREPFWIAEGYALSCTGPIIAKAIILVYLMHLVEKLIDVI